MPVRRSRSWTPPPAADEDSGTSDGETAEGRAGGAPRGAAPAEKGRHNAPARGRLRRAGGHGAPERARGTGVEAPVVRARAGLRRARVRRLVRRLRAASGRDHAVPGAGAPSGLRRRHRPLGALLRRAFVAGARPDRRGPGAVRRRGPRPARLVRRRRQAGLLRPFLGGSGRYVLLRSPPLRRKRGPGGARGRGLLVRAGRLRPQADDRVRGHRPADGVAGAVRAPGPGPAGGRLAGGPPGGAGRGGADAVRPARAGAARPALPARRWGVRAGRRVVAGGRGRSSRSPRPCSSSRSACSTR